MIELDRLKKLADAPVHLISDAQGMVIGNSQELALECISLRRIIEDTYEPTEDCRASDFICDYMLSPDDNLCPCQRVRGLT